jgi:hypothetical protein
MLAAFFRLAGQSPTRQQALRKVMTAHLLVLATGCWLVYDGGPRSAGVLGQMLLVSGVVEGAVLVGWRLTQLPKSQALEFLLVSPVGPGSLLRGEFLVGAARLALVTLAGLPLLTLLTVVRSPAHFREGPLLDHVDVGLLVWMPWTWGLVTGLGLTVWAYEPPPVRRWGGKLILGSVVLYLTLGILAGEHLRQWLRWLPGGVGWLVEEGFAAFHVYNPFAVMRDWFAAPGAAAAVGSRALGLNAAAVLAAVCSVGRAACRFKPHFDERHYAPVADVASSARGKIGDRPLSWWAVRRVAEYSGGVNVWLAAGFSGLYAAYLVAGAHWPPWLGRQAFVIFDNLGGVPAVTTALVLLAAVPAAFQYGLWDSSPQSRGRRLELLLLTRLGTRDYWNAAAAAAWRRGRWYLAVAGVLWLAAVAAGRLNVTCLAATVAAAVVLWGLYFALGFRAFVRGLPATGLGMLLTVGLPLLAYALGKTAGPLWGVLLPPGSVYAPAAGALTLPATVGILAGGLASLLLARRAFREGDAELRRWYAAQAGQPTGA